MSWRSKVGAVVLLALLGCPSDPAATDATSEGGSSTSSSTSSSSTSASSSESSTSSPDSSSSSSETGAPLPECPEYGGGQSVGTVEDPMLTEISGLGVSRTHAGVLWVHNDSGDDARVFAIDDTGATLASFAIEGVIALDWEDMAIGPGPDDGVDYLFIGDIGDNPELRANVVVYRVPEPDPSTGGDTIPGVARITLNYPDGAHNAETLLVDPETGDIVIVTKNERGMSGIWRAPFPHETGAAIDLEQIGELAFGVGALPGSPLATGGDISPDGATIAVRTYDTIYAWRRTPGATLAEAFATDPCALPMMPEPQGETIALTDDAYFTVSEGELSTLFRFELDG